MITLEATKTIAGQASSATTVSYTITGMELSTDETYKVLAQGQLSGSAATIYTAPASTSAFIKTIHVVNTNAGASKTFQLFIGGTGNANAITPTVTLPAGGWATWSEDGWGVYSSEGQRLGVGATGATGSTGSTGASGTDAGLPFKYSTADTSATDPTSTKFKLNNATIASVTALYISETDNNSNSVPTWIQSWDDSTSTVKGHLRFIKQGNNAIFGIFQVTGTITDNGTWDTVTLAHVASAGSWANDDVFLITFARTGDKGDTGNTGGTGPAPAGQIYLSAAGMWPSTTNGCAEAVKVELTTYDIDMYVLDFDGAGTTIEYAQCMVAMPSDWNAGTITAKFYWTVNASSTSTCKWGIQGVAFANDDLMTGTDWGTVVYVTDTALNGGAHEMMISDATSAVTIGNTPAAGEIVHFRVSRDPANDTMTQDARLLGVMITYTRS